MSPPWLFPPSPSYSSSTMQSSARPVGELLVVRRVGEHAEHRPRPIVIVPAGGVLAGVGMPRIRAVLVLEHVAVGVGHEADHVHVAVRVAARAVRFVAIDRAGAQAGVSDHAVVERVEAVLHFPPVGQAVAVRVRVQRIGLGPGSPASSSAVGVRVALDPAVEVRVLAVAVARAVAVGVGVVRVGLASRRSPTSRPASRPACTCPAPRRARQPSPSTQPLRFASSMPSGMPS